MDKIFGFLCLIIICGLAGLQGYSYYLDIETKQRNMPKQKTVTVYDTIHIKYNEDVNSVGKDIGQLIDTIYLKGGESWNTESDYIYSINNMRELQIKVENYAKKIEDYEVQDKGFGLVKSDDYLGKSIEELEKTVKEGERIISDFEKTVQESNKDISKEANELTEEYSYNGKGFELENKKSKTFSAKEEFKGFLIVMTICFLITFITVYPIIRKHKIKNNKL